LERRIAQIHLWHSKGQRTKSICHRWHFRSRTYTGEYKTLIIISDLVRDIKSNSSKWMNEKGFVKGKFQWQEGFGAFSYAQSQLDTLIAYINNQEQHHQQKSFKTEYLDLLQKFDIIYDENYLFEWIE
jgi:hypothetical protein